MLGPSIDSRCAAFDSAMLGALGKNGCKACHDNFREKS